VDGTDLSKYPSACQERAPDSDVAPRGGAAAAFSMPLLLRSLKERTNGLRERCVRFEAGDALPRTVPEFAARNVAQSAANSSRPTHVYLDGGGTMTPILRHEANFPSDLKE
jgi:hypothetical protein